MNSTAIKLAEELFATAEINEPSNGYLRESVCKAAWSLVECYGLVASHSGGNNHHLRRSVTTPSGRPVFSSPESFAKLSHSFREKLATNALAADTAWEAAVTAETVKFTGQLTVELSESKKYGPGRQRFAQCEGVYRQLDGLPENYIDQYGRPRKRYENPDQWAMWNLKHAAIEAALTAALVPSAPSNKVLHDFLAGDVQVTDSTATLAVTVDFTGGVVTRVQVGVAKTDKYQNFG